MALRGTKSEVRVQGIASESFQVKWGHIQADMLSTLLFNVLKKGESYAIEKVIRSTDINQGGSSLTTGLQYRTADDVALAVDWNHQSFSVDFSLMVKEGRKIGLQINEGKIKYMIVSRPHEEQRDGAGLEINKCNFEKVREFKYLGSIIMKSNEVQTEISENISLLIDVTKHSYFCYWLLSRKWKLIIYWTII